MKFSQAVCKQFALVKQEKWGQQTGDKIKELTYFHTLPIFQNGLIWFSQRFLKKKILHVQVRLKDRHFYILLCTKVRGNMFEFRRKLSLYELLCLFFIFYFIFHLFWLATMVLRIYKKLVKIQVAILRKFNIRIFI